MPDYDNLLPELQALTAKINAKIDKMLEPLRREMVVMRWPADMQALFWYHLADTAVKKAQMVEKDDT